MREFWSPKDVDFSRECIEWLLSNYDLLKQGVWPPEHKETGYTGDSSSRLSDRVKFQSPIEMVVEIDMRMKLLTKTQYMVVWLCCVDGHSIDEAASRMGLHYSLVEECREKGLNKISGWRRWEPRRAIDKK